MSWSPTVPLQDGEEVILSLGVPFKAVAAPVIVTLGLADAMRRLRRFVVTNQRVILMDGTPGGRKVVSIPLGRVQDASVEQRAWQGHVVITSAGGQAGRERIGPLMIADARKFSEAVLKGSGVTSGL